MRHERKALTELSTTLFLDRHNDHVRLYSNRLSTTHNLPYARIACSALLRVIPPFPPFPPTLSTPVVHGSPLGRPRAPSL